MRNRSLSRFTTLISTCFLVFPWSEWQNGVEWSGVDESGIESADGEVQKRYENQASAASEPESS